jgi:hypothetical protein
MLVTAASPDGQIQARISGPDGIELMFSRGSFEQYDEGTLCHQLERLGSLCWVAYDRAHTAKHRRALGMSAEEFANNERHPKDERRQRYDADLTAVEAEGVSPRGLVRVYARGMLHWRVDIERGAARRLGEHRFLSELDAALRMLFEDREVQITVIKSRYYDLGIPRNWRALLSDLAASAAESRQSSVKGGQGV